MTALDHLNGTSSVPGSATARTRYEIVGAGVLNSKSRSSLDGGGRCWLKKKKRIAVTCLVATFFVLVIVAAIVFITGSSSKATQIRIDPPDPESPLPPSYSTYHVFKNGAVCTDGPPCSEIGRDILERGGSAVDAAVAALFCNGVVNSQSMGPGGGFIMTVYDRKTRKAHSLVSREVAPLKATETMFVNDPLKSRNGALAIGVPGELRGYRAAWERFGKLDWKEIVMPAVSVCRQGYKMSKHQYDSLSFRPRDVFLKDPNFRDWFVDPDTNEFRKPGSVIKPIKLCETLQTIAERGADDFYNGTLAEIFLQDIKDHGGLITAQDLRSYEPKWREPMTANLHSGKTLYTAPAPGGGTLLAFVLNILDGYNMEATSVADINATILTNHRFIEAYKYAFALRSRLGDPDFNNISQLVHDMQSKEYAEKVRLQIQDDRTFDDPKHYEANSYNQPDHGTAHVSILAPNGDAVSVTSTVNLYFGAGITSHRTGIILNSGMDDFSVPGHTNYFNLPPSPENFIRPGKTSMSSVSPTVIVDDSGDVSMVIGASGGTKITTAIAAVIANYVWFNKTLKESVDESRIHHQLMPMEVTYEYGIIKPVIKGLEKLGHKMKRYRDRGSVVCALARLNNSTIVANADYRKGGEVYGI